MTPGDAIVSWKWNWILAMQQEFKAALQSGGGPLKALQWGVVPRPEFRPRNPHVVQFESVFYDVKVGLVVSDEKYSTTWWAMIDGHVLSGSQGRCETAVELLLERLPSKFELVINRAQTGLTALQGTSDD